MPTERLLEKLGRHGVAGKVLALLGSWLETRQAVVVVDGAKSDCVCLRDMVFQGSVWGPPLWNVFSQTLEQQCNKQASTTLTLLTTCVATETSLVQAETK